MNNYMYLIEVTPHTYLDKTRRWNVVTHSSDGTVTIAAETRIKWFAVYLARKIGRDTAKAQGENLRLELQIHNTDGTIAKKDSYGSDPRGGG